MRALVQRVSRAKVSIGDGQVIAHIGRGLLVFLGIGSGDTEEAARWLAEKVAHLRIFEDESGKLNFSCLEIGGAALVVSQFTLYGDARRGRRPDFTAAARPEFAEPLVERFAGYLAETGLPVTTGKFQAAMQVELVNDGPVTLWLER
ncbi:MAG: D-tyrosyl-tRNA(Tyr) deacylase [Chloroflexi bacterium]|nr:D-tyrosyl-tRNA(Tyr) deacylase [Chloroflexota bacterium]